MGLTDAQLAQLARGDGGLCFRGRGAVDLVVGGETVGDPFAVAQSLAERLLAAEALVTAQAAVPVALVLKGKKR